MNTVYARFSPDEYATYYQMVIELGVEEIDVVSAAIFTGKLCQLVNGAIYTLERQTKIFHGRKLAVLEGRIASANGKPVLVSYWFKHVLLHSQHHLNVRELKSNRGIANWNAGRIPVAVIHPVFAGHGLHLRADGSALIRFELTWLLGLYQPTNRRLWCQGQQVETVVIHHIVATGTVDEQIMETLSRKDASQFVLVYTINMNLEVSS